jgi:hypothetical protein
MLRRDQRRLIGARSLVYGLDDNYEVMTRMRARMHEITAELGYTPEAQ